VHRTPDFLVVVVSQKSVDADPASASGLRASSVAVDIGVFAVNAATNVVEVVALTVFVGL
jgi:hypothetical protein